MKMPTFNYNYVHYHCKAAEHIAFTNAISHLLYYLLCLMQLHKFHSFLL